MENLFYNQSWLDFIREKKSILTEVIKFDSKSKSSKIENVSTKIGDFSLPRDNKLREYLNTLELEDVLFIQSVMYIGRDKDHDPQKTPEAIFKSKRKEIGSENKTAEVNQIASKSRVTEYLLSGMDILKI